MVKMKEKLDLMKKQYDELEQILERLKRGKALKSRQLKKTEYKDKEEKQSETHLWSKQPTIEQVINRISTWKEKISKHEFNTKIII